MLDFKRISRWIEIKYTIKDGNAYFLYNGRRYHMGNVNTSCPIVFSISNPFYSAFYPEYKNGEIPSFVHGYTSEYNPLFIEINDAGDAVRIYKLKRDIMEE